MIDPKDLKVIEWALSAYAETFHPDDPRGEEPITLLFKLRNQQPSGRWEPVTPDNIVHFIDDDAIQGVNEDTGICHLAIIRRDMDDFTDDEQVGWKTSLPNDIRLCEWTLS